MFCCYRARFLQRLFFIFVCSHCKWCTLSNYSGWSRHVVHQIMVLKLHSLWNGTSLFQFWSETRQRLSQSHVCLCTLTSAAFGTCPASSSNEPTLAAANCSNRHSAGSEQLTAFRRVTQFITTRLSFNSQRNITAIEETWKIIRYWTTCPSLRHKAAALFRCWYCNESLLRILLQAQAYYPFLSAELVRHKIVFFTKNDNQSTQSWYKLACMHCAHKWSCSHAYEDKSGSFFVFFSQTMSLAAANSSSSMLGRI